LHAEAYHQVRGVGVALTRVAAARPERAARFAEEFGLSTVAASAEEVLAAPDVDVVDLCVPTSLHAPLAIAAARAGKHVIVEKPLTGCFAPASTPRAEMRRRALASGDEILAACRTSGVRLCYAENWVYAPPTQRVRRLLTAAGGPILRIVGEENHGGTHAPINKRWETGGGGSLIGKGCHPLGAAEFPLVEPLQGLGRGVGEPPPHPALSPDGGEGSERVPLPRSGRGDQNRSLGGCIQLDTLDSLSA
jgi:predicted dehydrogenase